MRDDSEVLALFGGRFGQIVESEFSFGVVVERWAKCDEVYHAIEN
jgi:hypothetical protein